MRHKDKVELYNIIFKFWLEHDVEWMEIIDAVSYEDIMSSPAFEQAVRELLGYAPLITSGEEVI